MQLQTIIPAALLALGACLGLAGAAPPAPPAPPEGAAFSGKQARSLLAARCFSCHAGSARLGGLRLDSRAGALKGGQRGPAVVPGDPDASRLIQAIRYDGPLKMPPAGRLSDEEIATLTAWVKTGAPSGTGVRSQRSGVSPANPQSEIRSPRFSHWSFQPVRAPKVPGVRNRAWVKNPVDAFVLAKLERRGLKPNPPADRRTLIRRVSLDLTGLPPTRAEVAAFLADRSADAYEKVVDRLLASPHYGERLALLWLDLGRYADSDGYHDDTDRTQWAYRDYVIRALNQDKPFDQFTVEQLAGDLLAGAAGAGSMGSMGSVGSTGQG